MNNNIQEATQFIQQAFQRAKPTEGGMKGKDDLVIWGGEFQAGGLGRFLMAWDKTLDKLTWRMVELVSSFDVKRQSNDLFGNEDDVERLRLFGESGDLDIRRDGNQHYWRFIGEGTDRWPDLGAYLAKDGDFFADYPQQLFHVITECYYQWRGGDARVGLDLSPYFPQYGHGRQAPGVYLKQEHYLVDGRIAFVRYLGFEEN